jgi:hypothetical protein
LDLSKNTLLVGNSCNNNNDDFKEMTGWKKMNEKYAGSMALYNSRKLRLSLKLDPRCLD